MAGAIDVDGGSLHASGTKLASCGSRAAHPTGPGGGGRARGKGNPHAAPLIGRAALATAAGADRGLGRGARLR